MGKKITVAGFKNLNVAIGPDGDYLPEDAMMTVYYDTNDIPFFDARPNDPYYYLTGDEVQQMAEELVKAASEMFEEAAVRREREEAKKRKRSAKR